MKAPVPPSFRADPFLRPYEGDLLRRAQRTEERAARLSLGCGRLCDFASAHEYYGLHRTRTGWVFREYAPNATSLRLTGDFCGWTHDPAYEAHRVPGTPGDWELRASASAFSHGQHYHVEVTWPGGSGVRLPAYARRVVQDAATGIFSAQVWDPPTPYRWAHPHWTRPPRDPVIYEAHVGMAQEEATVGTYEAFREKILPRIAKAGYNTLQLMGIMEHPYYGSFGYQVSNFFAASSRFGTPEELKALVDDAHGRGLAVIMDLVHSHAVSNEREGIARLDGSACYGHEGPRGHHPVWDSALLDYGRPATLHFLLSNCRFWLDAYRFDGFRFDGVTSMLYRHHGIGKDFLSYADYFDGSVDEEAWTYLALANRVIHDVRPDALTIAEDVSGMPGLAAPLADGGAGFDYRMAMGVTESWGRFIREENDGAHDLGRLWHDLRDKRADERTVSYVECHDQALVGGKTMFFEMTGPAIYDAMHRSSENLAVQRAVALHKMARLATAVSAGGGYLNFMGNEFGHPEWIDFPREGNGWDASHARRQWSLRDDSTLQFSFLADWDAAFLRLLRDRPDLLAQPVHTLDVDFSRQTLAFARGDLFFFLNFHPDASYEDMEVPVPPGAYRLVLDSDAPAFGGLGRVRQGQVFVPRRILRGDQAVDLLRLYLPTRTALVLER